MTSVPSFNVISAHACKRLLPVFTVLSSMLVLVIFASVTGNFDDRSDPYLRSFASKPVFSPTQVLSFPLVITPE